MIAQVLVVGIRQAERTPRRRLAEHDFEVARTVDARERRECDAFEHREDRGVQTDAEHEHADDGEREGGVLRERADGRSGRRS